MSGKNERRSRIKTRKEAFRAMKAAIKEGNYSVAAEMREIVQRWNNAGPV